MSLQELAIEPLVLPAIAGGRLTFVNGRYAAERSNIGATAGMKIVADGAFTKIEVAAGTEATLVESYSNEDQDGEYTTASKMKIVLGDHARLTHYKLVRESTHATHHSFLEIDVLAAAVFDSHVFLWGGAEIRNTINVKLLGDGAECSLNGLYLGRGETVIENETQIDHVKPRGTSRELYKGILDDRSNGIFDGLIIVEPDAQKTDSTQTNRNLLLSDEALAQSNPELKIYANDVKCKHGATIGQINPETLFYLRSRGISQEEARRLLITAFGAEMIQRVPSEPLRQTLEAALFNTFQTHV